jgi:endonuclease/exonuclease/phosphatase family metal-dependent hydrolase
MARLPDSLANWRGLDAQFGPEALRIASYNVHGCRGADGRKDAQRIVKVIEECGSDTIGLQEVDYRLDYIAHKLGMQPIPGLTLARHDGPFGNALITRRKVLAVRRLAFTYGGRERRYQVKQILKLLKETPICERVIVLGDINEWLPLGRPLRWMHALFGRPPAEWSFPARWPLVALDRVWVRPRHALLALKAHRSPLAEQASDHLPVKAIVSLSQSSADDARASSSLPSTEDAWRGDRTRVA